MSPTTTPRPALERSATTRPPAWRVGATALTLAICLAGCGWTTRAAAPGVTDAGRSDREPHRSSTAGPPVPERLSDLIGDLPVFAELEAVTGPGAEPLPLECDAALVLLASSLGQLAHPGERPPPDAELLRERLRRAVPADVAPTLDAIERLAVEQADAARRAGAGSPTLDELLTAPDQFRDRILPLAPHLEALEPWLVEHCGALLPAPR